MTPAENLARLFAKRNGLKPPVDIKRVLESCADVEEDDIPLDVDAIFLGKSKSRPRPLVILQKNRPDTRKTFTLGHELGHCVIPWHAGTFFCHTDFNARLDEFATKEVEAEANRFSSEILLPSDWVKQIAATRAIGGIRSKLLLMQTSGLSALACSFSLIRHLPAGCFFAEVDSAGIVRYSAASPKSPLEAPKIGRSVDITHQKLCDPPEQIQGSIGTTYYWWNMLSAGLEPEEPSRTSRDILTEIFEDLKLTRSETQEAQYSINGIIGAANSKFKETPHINFVALIRGRFLDRGQLEPIVKHRLFDQFVHARAAELRKRHGASTGR